MGEPIRDVRDDNTGMIPAMPILERVRVMLTIERIWNGEETETRDVLAYGQ